MYTTAGQLVIDDPCVYFLFHPALVNKGNVLFSRGEFEKAREFYQEALSVEATCCEALFNIGLVHKKMRRYMYMYVYTHQVESYTMLGF